MDSKGGGSYGGARGRRPRQKTLLIAIVAIILIAALIAVIVVAIHNNNKDNGGGPQVGTIPGPIIMPPFIPPPTLLPPPTTSPPVVYLPPPPPKSPPISIPSPPLSPPSTPLLPPSPPLSPPSTPVTPPSTPAVSNTIVVACNDALYRNLCISSLSSYPGASTANLTQLASIAVEISLDEGKQASDFMDDLSRKSTDKKDKSALDDCVDLLQDTVDQLNNSLSTLRSMDSDSFQDAIGDVQTWVSAALTNPTTCVEGFQEVNANMIPVVKARTENVTEFMSNALAVINKLATTQDLVKGHENVVRTRRLLLVDDVRLHRLQIPYTM